MTPDASHQPSCRHGEKPCLHLPVIHTQPRTTPFLCCFTDMVSIGSCTHRVFRSPLPGLHRTGAAHGIGASHGTVMQCYTNGYSRAQGTLFAQNTPPCLSGQEKAQSCCSTWPIFSASVPSGRVGAFQAGVLCQGRSTHCSTNTWKAWLVCKASRRLHTDHTRASTSKVFPS